METKFGKEIREEFPLQPGSIFVNHGSYGVVPKRVKEAQHRYIDEMDRHPEDWFRRTNIKLWKEARDAAAKFVNCDPEDLVFVQNATTGINTILRSLTFEDGDIILATDNTYKAVQNACKSTSTSIKGGQTHLMPISFPVNSEDDIIDMYRDFLRSNDNVKIAVIDHITSPTAMVLPVKRLIDLCKEHGVMTLIDAAHAPGHLPLNLIELGADFYTGNLHKWAFTPRGCAILYIKREHHDLIAPLVTSHNYQKGNFLSFFMQGTRDDSAYVCVQEALQFYEDIGGYEKIKEYNSGLLDKAVDMMVKSWGTEKLQIPKSMEAPFMRLVKLPDIPGYDKNLEGSEDLFNYIRFQYDIVCVDIPVNGELYMRLSAQVYNTMEDYEKLTNVILEMMNKG